MDTAERLEKVKNGPRSVSQYNQYNKCPYAYYLQRVEQVWQRPAAWFPQGTAVHKAAEEWELSERTMSLEEAEDIYRDEYAKEVNRYCQVAPFDRWFSSGPYKAGTETEARGKTYEPDVERRFKLGLEQVSKYITWYQDHPTERIWVTPDGELAVELAFSIDYDGVTVNGFIDAVIAVLNPDGTYRIIVRDNKTGNNPGDDFQLAVYADAIRVKYGEDVSTGDYWMGKSGKPTVPYKLNQWTHEALAAEFRLMDEAVKAEKFEPDPEPDKCNFCTVNHACDFFAR